MPLSVSCPSCGGKLRASDKLLGRKARCPKCGQPIVFAAPADPAPGAGSPPAGPGARPGTYYVRDHQGRVSGPFSAADLKRLAGERKLDLSWQISGDRVNWSTAAKVKNLFG